MATEAAIAEVKSNLPDDAEWDDEKIGQALDTFAQSVSRAVRSFWAKRVANTANLIDVSESGSTRQLSRRYDNAVQQVAYWDKVIADEAAEQAEVIGSFSRKIRRV